MEILKQSLLTLALFLALDFIWLGLLMSDFYLKELGDLARKAGGRLDPNWIAAIFVYLIITFGIVYFVLPHTQPSDLLGAFIRGALLGLVMYGVYDFTNLATLANYSVKLTVIDVLWGMFATGTAATLVTLLLK